MMSAMLAVLVTTVGWVAAGSADMQPVRPQAPPNHPPIAPPPRPARDIGDLTADVATALPSTPGVSPIVERTLIDRQLVRSWASNNIPHAPLSDDYEFCRRVYLDLTGRIPPADRLLAFVSSNAADKRDQLIDELLDSQAWVDHWGYWYGDLLRNCAQPHRQRRDEALRRLAAAIVQGGQAVRPARHGDAHRVGARIPTGCRMRRPRPFLARWHVAGDTMYSDQLRGHRRRNRRPVGAVVSRDQLSVHLLPQRQGTSSRRSNLDLVSQNRADFWAMAAFFGRTRVRAVRYQDRFIVTDDGTGYDTRAASSVRLQRAGAGCAADVHADAGKRPIETKPLRPQFARMLTSHPQFARATVNLIWKQFFGLGIVEPVDGFDMARQDPANPPPAPWTIQPTNPGLLDALARDFAENGFSLKHLMRTIARSSAYQLSSRFDGEWQERYTPYFARHYVQRADGRADFTTRSVQATQVFGDYRGADMVYGTPLPPVRFWTEAPTPEEIGNGEAKTFLRTFGQANREQFDRQPGGSILQAMMLMNSAFVTRRVRAEGGSRVEQLRQVDRRPAPRSSMRSTSPTLSRPPTADERETRAGVGSRADRKRAEDLQWSLAEQAGFRLQLLTREGL